MKTPAVVHTQVQKPIAPEARQTRPSPSRPSYEEVQRYHGVRVEARQKEKMETAVKQENDPWEREMKTARAFIAVHSSKNNTR